MQPARPPRDDLSTTQAAAIIGMSPNAVRRLFDRGELGGFWASDVLGTRRVRRYPRQVVEAYARARSSQQHPPANTDSDRNGGHTHTHTHM